jgi:hypothetical protein
MSMKLAQYGHELNGLAEKLDEYRLAQESLAFCYTVYRDYTVGDKAANDHMDVHKATKQLLDAINRILQV